MRAWSYKMQAPFSVSYERLGRELDGGGWGSVGTALEQCGDIVYGQINVLFSF